MGIAEKHSADTEKTDGEEVIGMMKKTLKLAGIGFLLGIAVCSFISAIFGNGETAPESLIAKVGSVKIARLLQLGLSGLYGACCMGFTVLYDMDRIPVAAATLIHGVICVGTFIPLSLFLGWFERIEETLVMTGCQIAAFFCIWLIMYLVFRKETRELNKIQNTYLEKSNPEEESK